MAARQVQGCHLEPQLVGTNSREQLGVRAAVLCAAFMEKDTSRYLDLSAAPANSYSDQRLSLNTTSRLFSAKTRSTWVIRVI